MNRKSELLTKFVVTLFGSQSSHKRPKPSVVTTRDDGIGFLTGS
jgi:hypothetical protein